MSDSILSAPHFHNEEAAYKFIEARLWPHGPVCPKCGVIGGHYKLKGKSTRPGVYKCADCRKPFRVTVGTIFEASHIKLNIWLQAIYLMSGSKKGISSHQLRRMLGITIKSAWFLSHRIREAMKHDGGVFSAGGSIIEADETYVGGKQQNKHANKRLKNAAGGLGKEMVFALIDRETGKARSFHLPSVNAANLRPILNAQLNTAKTRLMTDGEGQYRILAPMFASHESVNHSGGEYVRGDAHTNTVEGYFSILKRGIIGTFHHVSPQHLQRYVTEFDFRYNNRETKTKIDGKWMKTGLNDTERADALLAGVKGKRLTYQTANIG
jgi:transposase-like protein